MLPAQQCLGLAHVAVAQVELGLIAQEQFVFDGGAAQVANQADLALMGKVAVLLIDLQIAGQRGRIVARNGRAADQFFDLLAIFGVGGNAHAHFVAQFIDTHPLRLGQQAVQAVGAGHGAVELGVFQQHQKFAAGNARRRIPGRQARQQAAAGFAQHFLDPLGPKPSLITR